MGARQITCTHEKFIHDLTAGKAECLLEEFHPFLFCLWMMMVQPFFKRTYLFLNFQDLLGAKKREFSSAGSEHLPYKQRVGGSNPSTPTWCTISQ
jgi:hypothetical protein